MNPPFSKWKLLAMIAGTVLVADQVTKYLAVAHLTWAFETAHRLLPAVNFSSFREEHPTAMPRLHQPFTQQIRINANHGVHVHHQLLRQRPHTEKLLSRKKTAGSRPEPHLITDLFVNRNGGPGGDGDLKAHGVTTVI